MLRSRLSGSAVRALAPVHVLTPLRSQARAPGCSSATCLAALRRQDTVRKTRCAASNISVAGPAVAVLIDVGNAQEKAVAVLQHATAALLGSRGDVLW